MSLTDTQIWDLAKRMNIPLVFCDFKDNLPLTGDLKYNKAYIINMENEYDQNGEPNEGSHYTCFQVNKYPNGRKEGVYFDSFGQPPPQIVDKFCGMKMPYQKKDIQSLMNSACGWYSLAFLHYINSYEGRSKHLYTDCETFTEMFDDLNVSVDHLRNEYILKHFFRSVDPATRKPVDVGGSFKKIVTDINTIDGEDEDNKKSL